MNAIIETTAGLSQDEITALKIIRDTINNADKCGSMESALQWLDCLSGWFIYTGANHIAVMRYNGGDRLMIVTEAKPKLSEVEMMAQHSISTLAASITALCQSWGGQQVPCAAISEFVQALHIKGNQFEALQSAVNAADEFAKVFVKNCDTSNPAILSAFETLARSLKAVK